MEAKSFKAFDEKIDAQLAGETHKYFGMGCGFLVHEDESIICGQDERGIGTGC
jgi:hypothetical protein